MGLTLEVADVAICLAAIVYVKHARGEYTLEMDVLEQRLADYVIETEPDAGCQKCWGSYDGTKGGEKDADKNNDCNCNTVNVRGGGSWYPEMAG